MRRLWLKFRLRLLARKLAHLEAMLRASSETGYYPRRNFSLREETARLRYHEWMLRYRIWGQLPPARLEAVKGEEVAR
jgi:hypothetical protein